MGRDGCNYFAVIANGSLCCDDHPPMCIDNTENRLLRCGYVVAFCCGNPSRFMKRARNLGPRGHRIKWGMLEIKQT